VADDSVAGIHISIRRHRDIFIAASAAPQPFDGTGPLVEIQHEMKEIKIILGIMALNHKFCKALIFGKISPADRFP
jgi:hypothetical protein